MQSRLHINALPSELLQHILTFAFPKKPGDYSGIHETCVCWYEILQTSIKQLHEVNAILKKINAINQAAREQIQAGGTRLGDEAEKIAFPEFSCKTILLADQLEILALPPVTGHGNTYAQLLMFYLHGSSFFAEYIDVVESMNFWSGVIPESQKNPVKAYYYLELAMRQNSFAHELWQRIMLPSAFYSLVEKERKTETDFLFARFVASFSQEQKRNSLGSQTVYMPG